AAKPSRRSKRSWRSARSKRAADACRAASNSLCDRHPGSVFVEARLPQPEQVRILAGEGFDDLLARHVGELAAERHVLHVALALQIERVIDRVGRAVELERAQLESLA